MWYQRQLCRWPGSSGEPRQVRSGQGGVGWALGGCGYLSKLTQLLARKRALPLFKLMGGTLSAWRVEDQPTQRWTPRSAQFHTETYSLSASRERPREGCPGLLKAQRPKAFGQRYTENSNKRPPLFYHDFVLFNPKPPESV